MPFAVLANVAGILDEPVDAISDAQVALDVANRWVADAYGIATTGAGTFTKSFFNVTDTDILDLGVSDPVNVSVARFSMSGEESTYDLFLGSPNFQILDDGRVQLLASHLVSIHDFPGVVGRTYARTFLRVDITYTTAGSVPEPVTYATALIAAATYMQRGNDVSSLARETIGRYSYAIDRTSKATLVIPDRARAFLSPYSRRMNVRVV